MPISVIDSTGLASPLTGLNNPTVVGNMTFSTSGSGVIFTNTTSGVLTNSTLNDYETGTWTPTDASGAGLTLTNNYAHYTKVGNLVTVTAYITWPSTVNTAAPSVGGLPFSGVNNGYATGIVSTNMNNSIICLTRYQPTGTTFYVNPAAGNGSLGNNNLSTAYIIFTMTYQASF